MADKKRDDDPYAINRENAGQPQMPSQGVGGGSDSSPPPGGGKMDAAAAVGGGIVDTLTLGHADALEKWLRERFGTKDAPKQTSSELAAEHPIAHGAGQALAMALPVAGTEALLGNLGRAGVTGLTGLGGEGALAAAGRAAGAELLTGEAMQAGRAATGADADWTAPLVNAAFAGPLAGFGQKVSDILAPAAQQAGKTVRQAVGDVPAGTPLASQVADPTASVRGPLQQTAPEALQRAGLGQQAADAEALLRRTLGGDAPVVPGRDAALAGGKAVRDTASSAAEDAMIKAGSKDVLSPFGTTPDLQDIHFKSAGQRPPGSSTLFDYAQTLEEASKQAAANPKLGGEIDVALSELAGQGRPEIGDLFSAHRAGKNFDEFAKSFGVNPTAAAPGAGVKAAGTAAKYGARAGVDALAGMVPGGSTISSMFGLSDAAGRLAQQAIGKVTGLLPAGAPRNAALIEKILMDPIAFAGVLQPEEIAALTQLAAARAVVSGTPGGAKQAGQGSPSSLERRYPSAF